MLDALWSIGRRAVAFCCRPKRRCGEVGLKVCLSGAKQFAAHGHCCAIRELEGGALSLRNWEEGERNELSVLRHWCCVSCGTALLCSMGALLDTLGLANTAASLSRLLCCAFFFSNS